MCIRDRSVLDNAVGSVGDAFKYIGAGIAENVTGEYQWINTYDTAAARVNTCLLYTSRCV